MVAICVPWIHGEVDPPAVAFRPDYQILDRDLRALRNSSAHGNTQFEAQPFPRHGKDVEVVFPDWRYSIY